MIFYAGRDRDLADLIRALSTRSQCGHDTPITVMTGATGAFAQGQQVRALLKDSKITILDVSATSPAQWVRGVHAPSGFKPFHQALRDLRFPDSVMDDGYAIMHHDAVLTAIWATRNVTGQTGKEAPDVQDVYNEITNLHDASTVPAAGGELSFDDASQGWPHNKPVPVIRLPEPLKDPGRLTWCRDLALLRFPGSAWAVGRTGGSPVGRAVGRAGGCLPGTVGRPVGAVGRMGLVGSSVR